VTHADWRGGVINGRQQAWSGLGPAERLRLVDERGGSLLVAVQRNGAPFVDWATVFRRASDRIRDRFEPRFPHVHPHRLRHSFSLGTLEDLVSGYYAQAAKLVADTDNNAALAPAAHWCRDPDLVLKVMPLVYGAGSRHRRHPGDPPVFIKRSRRRSGQGVIPRRAGPRS